MRTHPILVVAAGMMLAACDARTDPSSVGTLVVSTTSAGNDPDRDGFLLTVDGRDSLPLDPTGTSQIDLPAGRHALRLLGTAEHCSVSPATPLDVAVGSGDTTSVAFEVTCSVTGIRITNTTTGLDFGTAGHRVEVDGVEQGLFPLNGTVLIRLEPGTRTIALTGMRTNCAVDGAASRTVTLGATDIVPIEFAVVCTAASGVIGIVITGSGVGVVHQAMVDSGTPFPVGPGYGSYVGGVPSGDHVVSLTPRTGCSVDIDQQSVTVTTGGLIRDTVEVTFPVTCETPPPGARVAFVRKSQPRPDGTPGPGSPDIYLAKADGSQATWLTDGESPAWSPDGLSIAFHRGETIHVIDVDRSNERSLARGGYPAWSPDGTRIVFPGPDDGHGRRGGIFVINPDGSRLTRLISRDFANPGSRDGVAWPEWSPDGRRISFVRTPEFFAPWQIYVMDADGSNPRHLDVLRSVRGGGFLAEVHSWSPDGSRIALGVASSSWTIASVDSTGGDYRVHYREEPQGYAAHPDWSPDGLRIVFNRYTTTTGCEIPSCPMRIFIVNTEGGPARQLIPELPQAPAYWDHQPAWSRANE